MFCPTLSFSLSTLLQFLYLILELSPTPNIIAVPENRIGGWSEASMEALFFIEGQRLGTGKQLGANKSYSSFSRGGRRTLKGKIGMNKPRSSLVMRSTHHPSNETPTLELPKVLQGSTLGSIAL